jgi:hypothetical protein
MSLLDKLGIAKDKRKSDPTATMNFTQKQEYLKAQAKKRAMQQPAMPKPEAQYTSRECPVCQKVMKVSVGQLQFCHKECKPRYKRALARKVK